MSGTFTDVMVDLETSGTRADRAGIIQISAVKFNLETGEVDANFFDMCPQIMPHRGWDEGTRTFWMKHKSVLEDIYGRLEDTRTVFQQFIEWVGIEPLCFWSKPLHFDYPFVESHLHDLGLLSPFHYRNTIDMRSWIKGTGIEPPEIEFQGSAHNALYDVLHQLEVVLKVRELKNAENMGSVGSVAA